MKYIILLISTIILLGCKVKNIDKKESFNVFRLQSELGDVIYNNFSNDIFFDKWPNDELIVKYKPDDNCIIKESEYYLTVTPINNPKNIVIEAEFPNGQTKKFIFKVVELPEPKLYYNLNSEVDKKTLKNEINKSEIKNLFFLEALTEIGKLSWVTYELLQFDIMIIRNKEVIFNKTNIGSEMNIENKSFLEKLITDDILLFRNIKVKQETQDKILTFNEKSITIK